MENVIVGIGEALWDVLPDGKKIGGAPANFAYHVSQFGLNGLAISAVGNDELGRELTATLDSKNLNYIMPTVDFPTGVVMVEVDTYGIPQYDIKTNVAWDHIPFDVRIEQAARNACAVCFGSLAQRSQESRHTIMRFLDSVPLGRNVLKVFDINLRQDFYSRETICESLSHCNVLKINDEELDMIGHMFGYPDLSSEDKCRLLLGKYNLKMLILTCGVNGSYVFTPGNVSFQPTPKVEVADTVGAGDSFTASFIASIIKGKSVAQAHRIAAQASAYVCTQYGAMPIFPKELTE